MVFQPVASNVRDTDEANIEFTNEPIPCQKEAENN